MDGEAAIRIERLSKTYAGGKQALDDVSFDVPRGIIFGLLGPNGAGKSTLINILAGLVLKTAGRARVWGFDIDEHPRNAKRSIGIVPQEILFDPFFTPREALEIQAGLYGIPPGERKTAALLAAMHLSDKADAYARTLSGGMKRRLLVAKAMVHSPPILVLDEPTAGVDIELRRQLWKYVRELNAGGYTHVVTMYDPFDPAKGNLTDTKEALWTRTDPHAKQVLRDGPVSVFEIVAPLDPEACGDLPDLTPAELNGDSVNLEPSANQPPPGAAREARGGEGDGAPPGDPGDDAAGAAASPSPS